MLRLKNLSNKYQKRLIRPEYAQTQATPYAATLDGSLRDSNGDLRLPASGDAAGSTHNPLSVARTDKAYTLKNSLIPGLVLVRLKDSEKVVVGSGGAVAEQPLGLLANFVGGDLDEGFAGDSLQNEVGVWRGPASTYSLLAPAFNDAGTTTSGGAITGAQSIDSLITNTTQGVAALLYCGPDGRLTAYTTPPTNAVAVARLVEKVSASRIVVELLV